MPHLAILEIEEMEEPKIIQVGNYMDDTGRGFRNPQCGRVYSADGIAPTLNTCGGGDRGPKILETAVLTPIRTEEQRQLRRKGIDTFGGRQLLPRTDGVSNTITTVTKDDLLQETCILGYTRDHKGGIQNYHEREVAGTIHTSTGRGGNTDQFVKEQVIKNEEQYGKTKTRRISPISKESSPREVLSILRQEIGAEAYKRTLGRLQCILEAEILRYNVHEKRICQERSYKSELEGGSCVRPKDCILDRKSSESMRNLRSDEQCGYTPQGWKPSEQYLRELDACLSELSHEAPQTSECLCNMWETGAYSPWYVRQTLHSLEKIWRPQSQAVEYIPKVRFRIRKLTEREIFRLMDVDDADIDKIDAYRIRQTLKTGKVKEKPIPKSQKYKLAGNSIVVSCLYHIFKGMFIDEKPPLPPRQLNLFDDLWHEN